MQPSSAFCSGVFFRFSVTALSDPTVGKLPVDRIQAVTSYLGPSSCDRIGRFDVARCGAYPIRRSQPRA